MSEVERDDPFNEVTLDLLVTDPAGQERAIPAFWAGDRQWRVRYAPARGGRHVVSSRCSDAGDGGLHGAAGELHVTEAADVSNPLLRHGPIQVAAGRRHLEHADGTPFLWLADTWWMGLCRRLRWPEEFHALTADRTAKGFNVVQLVAGLYPDMEPFDERGRVTAASRGGTTFPPSSPPTSTPPTGASRTWSRTASCRAWSASGATISRSPA